MAQSIGFVGLGTMGGRMVKRLLDAGHGVVGYNRTNGKDDWLVDAGMTRASTPRAVAESCQVVLSMLTDDRAVRSVAESAEGLLAGVGSGSVFVDMSTSHPERSAQLASEFAAAGAVMLDAPVSGSISTLEAGQLSVMVGGDEAAYERVRPLLLDIGPKVTRIGANGQALLVKLAINLGIVVQMTAFCEGVALAEKGGVRREVAVDAILNSVVASPMLGYRGPFVLEGRMPSVAWANVHLQQKDMYLALEMGRRLTVPLPTANAANELLTACRGMGLTTQDFAIVYEVYARLSGISN